MSGSGPAQQPGHGPRPGPANRPRRPVPRMRMLLLGRFFGVPIYFAPSWLIIAVLLTVNYAPVVEDGAGASRSSAYLVSFAYAVLFAVSVLLHEIGHTAVSLALGKPVKQIVIFLLGGVSEIEQEPDRPRDEFLIAAAGPLMSALITGGLFLGYQATSDHSLPGVLVQMLLWSNLIVLIFNLLPGLPLDGGRLLRSAVWAVSHSQLAGTRAGVWTGRAVAVGVLLLSPLANRGDYGLVSGVVCALLALYLWFGASQSLRVAEVMHRLPTIDMETLLRPGLLVPADLSIDAALQRMWQGRARGLVLVDAADRPSAIVDEARVNAVPPDRRPWTSLTAVARPLEDGLVLQRGLSGEQLLDAVRRTPASEYLVVDRAGTPAGILARADFAAALNASDLG